MAGRLIQRFSRLLVAWPYFPTPSCSISFELIRACHPIQSMLPRGLPLHISAICRYTDSLLEEKQNMNTLSKTDVLLKIYSMTTAEELLNSSHECCVQPYIAVVIIKQIARVTKTNQADVVADPRFQKLLAMVNGKIQMIRNNLLISLLQSLYVLRIDGKNHFLRSVETEIRWRTRSLSIVLLGRLARISVPHAQTEEQKLLVLDVAKHVMYRWMEVKDPVTLVNVVNYLGPVCMTLLERMEEKMLELAEFLTPLQVRDITLRLAAQKYRSLPVLRIISFHLVQRNFELSPSVIVDLAYAYAILNFGQYNVLQKFASDLLPKVPELSSKAITGVFRSFASLGYLDLLLCEAILKVCVEQSHSFTPIQLSGIIQSFAQLNFLPRQQEEFFSMVMELLSPELDSLSPTRLVDLVWSLCVLQLVTPALLEKTLVPKIYNQIMGETSKKSFYSMKLAQINATAQLECPEYRGSPLPLSLVTTGSPLVENCKLSALQSSLKNVLQDVFSDDSMYDYNVKTVYGHEIDAEFVLDSEHNPLPLRNFEDPHVLHSNGTQALPEGSRRFAVKCWESSNFCLHTKDLTGHNALCRRHLQAAGFLLVEVPFYEWWELKSKWQKSSFLKDQIKKVVAEQMSV